MFAHFCTKKCINSAKNTYNGHTMIEKLACLTYTESNTREVGEEMKTQEDVRVTIRVDRDLKESAEALFARLGLNMSTALNIYLRKAVDESAIPFAVSEKRTNFGAGYSADDVSSAFSATVQKEIIQKRDKGFPVARYDADKRQAYLETADGKRVYVSE